MCELLCTDAKKEPDFWNNLRVSTVYGHARKILSSTGSNGDKQANEQSRQQIICSSKIITYVSYYQIDDRKRRNCNILEDDFYFILTCSLYAELQ
jgi:hypothetical protein